MLRLEAWRVRTRLAMLAVVLVCGLTAFRAAALPPVIDLDSTPADVRVRVDNAEDFLGNSVAAGDINGDTTDDLIIGSFGADTAGRIDAGEVYVIYGRGDLPAIIDLTTTSASVRVRGAEANDFLGFAVASGDINGDTTDDVIVSARLADPAGRNDAGETHVIYGGPDLPATIDLSTRGPGLAVYGDDAGDQSGYAVACGDINGDTTDDLIIGAFLADRPGEANAGETYVIFGGSDLPATIDLDTTSASLTIQGRDADDRSGWSVAAGDVNGDATDDLIVGARLAEPPGSDDTGETYVVYGGAGLPDVIDLDANGADLTVYGRDDGDRSANAVGAGDINADTTDDLIIGAHHASPAGGSNAGEAYVVLGAPNLPATIELATADADMTILGDDPYDHTGVSVTAADINGDTIHDLITGAFGADGPGAGAEGGFAQPGDRYGAGEVYVIYGARSLSGVIDMDSASADLTVYGDDARDYSGYTIAAGDINGDTTDDLVIGARLAHAGVGGAAGDTHVIYGEPRSTPTPCAQDSCVTPTITATVPATSTRTATPAATATPTPTASPNRPLGDTDCDSSVNGIDAALVLQFVAGVVGSLPCHENADVNQDSMVNAIDAALILQLTAGILDRLPP